MTTPDGLLTKDHLADYLKVKPRTIDKYTKLGMPHIKIGDLKRYDLVAVVKWLQDRDEISFEEVKNG